MILRASAVFVAGAAALALSGCQTPGFGPGSQGGVLINTDVGPLMVLPDYRRAPETSCFFVRHAIRFSPDTRGGYNWFRRPRHVETPSHVSVVMARSPEVPARRHESTRETGMTNLAGAVSLSRDGGPGGSNFSLFLIIDDTPEFDTGAGVHGASPGFPVFGRLTDDSLEVARAIRERAPRPGLVRILSMSLIGPNPPRSCTA